MERIYVEAAVNEVPEYTGGVNDTTPPTVPNTPAGEAPKPTNPEASNGDALVQPELPEFKRWCKTPLLLLLMKFMISVLTILKSKNLKRIRTNSKRY